MKKSISVALFVLCIIIGGGVYMFTRKTPDNPPEKAVVAEPTQVFVNDKSASPTSDLLVGWKTYSQKTYGISFKYPDGYRVEERSAGFFVIVSEKENVPQGGISIDARQKNSYESLSKAVAAINESFTVTSSRKVKEWTLYDVTGKEGMLSGQSFKMALAPYTTGAIEMETIATSSYAALFEQVLSTFEFIH